MSSGTHQGMGMGDFYVESKKEKPPLDEEVRSLLREILDWKVSKPLNKSTSGKEETSV